MKQIFIFLALTVFLQSFTRAQMKQGSILLGGDVTFFSQKASGTAPGASMPKNSGFTFSPSAALALHDNFYAGIRLSYVHTSQDEMDASSPATTQKFDQFGGGVFLREYKPLGTHFFFFVEENLNGGASKYKITESGTSGGSIDKTFFVNLSVYPGVSYSVTPHFQLETGLQNFFSLNYLHGNYDGGGKQNSFNAGTAFSETFNNLYLGARFLFGQ